MGRSRTKYDIAEQVRQFDKKIATILKELLGKKKLSKEKMLSYIKIYMSVAR